VSLNWWTLIAQSYTRRKETWDVTIDSAAPEGTLLDSLLEPFGECLTPEVARKLANLQAGPAVMARVEELADKCNEGTLTADEHAEYESYVHVNHVLTLLKARARKVLQSIATSSA
jgi:uncharacterized protein YnzC (UPF0291/DUF896 family)